MIHALWRWFLARWSRRIDPDWQEDRRARLDAQIAALRKFVEAHAGPRRREVTSRHD